MRTLELIDAAKKAAGLPSDYALAARLGVTRQAVSGYRAGRIVPDPLVGFLLAEMIGADPINVIGHLELEKAEKSHREDAASMWRTILGRTATAAKEYRDKATGAVVTGFMVGTLLLAPPPANASSNSPLKTEPVAQGDSVYYVNPRRRKERRKRGAMAAMARTLAGFSKHRLN